MEKLLSQISVEDLEKYRIWIYTKDNDDMESVSSVDTNEISDGNISYIVTTRFTDATGESYIGYSSPQDPSGLDYVQPVFFSDGNQFAIFPDRELSDHERITFCETLGKTFSTIFPIHAQPLVKVNGKMIEMIIHDFESLSVSDVQSSPDYA